MFRVHPSFRGEGIRLASPARVTSLALLALTLACHATPAFAQKAPAPEPQLNQPGKDVQWVPTPPALVEKMLDLAQVTRDDRFVDLGSGVAAHKVDLFLAADLQSLVAVHEST